MYGLKPAAHNINSMKDARAWFNPPYQEPNKYETWWQEDEKLQSIAKETNGRMPPFRVFIDKSTKVYLVRNVSEVKKCEECGVRYSHTHTCNTRTASYYYHNIKSDTKNMWSFVKFAPVGTVETTLRLFIVYDIETYTKFGKHGKQLVPYLLVFHLQGDEMLIKIAVSIAGKLFNSYDKNTYYILERDANIVGHRFKTFRQELQTALAMHIWVKFKELHNLTEDMPHNKLTDMSKRLDPAKQPIYWEVIVVGHNISGFDEIILASHVATSPDPDAIPMFKVDRTFMPRAGKLLFNDVTYKLPNPSYTKPDQSTFARWRHGIKGETDLKWQGLKFMVRDTYLLTHCSLRDAAQAYKLPIEKGSCPYTAINDLFMLGDYEKDANNYPALRYWKDKQEYETNKTGKPYDIIKEALDYCVKDVMVTSALVEALLKGYETFCRAEIQLNCKFNVFQRPTISSNTHALFKQVYYRDNLLSKEYLQEYMVPCEQMYDYVRQSVRGGRCYPSYLGVYDRPVYIYDVCGMYASALTHPMPIGIPMNQLRANIEINRWQEKLDGLQEIDFFDKTLKPMIVTASADPPTLAHLDTLPPICIRTQDKLCWSNEPFEDQIVTSIDLTILHNRGWKCTINREKYAVVWPEFKPICSNYVQLNIKAKETADRTGNQIQRSISKLLSNALYGSFCTRLDNRKIVFEHELTETDYEDLQSETTEVVTRTTLINNSMPVFDTSKWNSYFNLPHTTDSTDSHTEISEGNVGLFIGENSQKEEQNTASIFTPVPCDQLILATIEKKSKWIENRSYPTQIASFVLAWTRAFTSEWANFLYGADRGKLNIEDRTLKHLYGDTDSLFVTQEGHECMLRAGAARLKHNNAKLIFNEADPKLTWAVECETRCGVCGEIAYATESCYLAPKLYAIKELKCTVCHQTTAGKLRAKGHNREQLTFQLMKDCFIHYDLFRPDETTKEKAPARYQTARMTLKKTMTPALNTEIPFTIMEKQLCRILRPWKDKTQRLGKMVSGGYYLYPYDRSHPNPRQTEPLTVTLS